MRRKFSLKVPVKKLIVLTRRTFVSLVGIITTSFAILEILQKLDIFDYANWLESKRAAFAANTTAQNYQSDFLAILEPIIESGWFSPAATVASILFVLYLLTFPVGGIAGRVSIYRLINYARPFRYARLIRDFHEFEHEWLKAFEADEISFQLALRDCLDAASATLSHFCGANVATCIKVFEVKEGTSPDGELDFKDTFLRTLERGRSMREISKNVYRRNTEIYRIVKGNSGTAKKLYQNNVNSQKYKQCSAYNYVFGGCAHFWVNNDLKDAVDKKKFFNESKDFLDYYKAMGIFILSPPLDEGESVNMSPTTPGIFVVDSLEKGCFDGWLFPVIAGYFSHRFYEILATFEARKAQKQ